MWVFEEEVNGEKLSHIINNTHENFKYLPGNSNKTSYLFTVYLIPDILVSALTCALVRVLVCAFTLGRCLSPVVGSNHSKVFQL